MVQTSGNFPQFVDFDPVLTDIFYNQYKRDLGNGGVMATFAMRNSSKAKETDLQVGGFSDPKPFTGKITYTDAERGYEIEYDFDEWVNGFQITRKMRDDMQYDGIFANATELATSFARKRRKDAASVYNNGASSSYLGFDGKSLFASDHPRSRTDTTNTVSNLNTLALTSVNLETAVVAMQAFKDDLGEEITIVPDTLVVGRNLRKTAIEITASPQVPENANNAINVQNGAWNVVVDPYISSSTAWWIIDSTMSNRYLKWYDRIPVEFAGMQDFETMIWKYRGYARYGYGWSDWRFGYRGNA
jgi:phage major head subunit gpT-like protein